MDDNLWFKLKKIINSIALEKKVPEEMSNMFMVLIPKQDSKKLRGIGIVEILWKIIAYLLKYHLKKK